MFAMWERFGMDVLSLRHELGLSQNEFAAKIGLTSKGHMSEIERGKAQPSVRVALEIERLSEGRLPAASLNDDVALVEKFRGFQ